MDKKTKGAWLVHHTNKLQAVSSQNGFENTYLAGKAGILLSAISASNEIEMDVEKVEVLAQASNINRATELKVILPMLKDKYLIDFTRDHKKVVVLGLTTTSALNHTADIFDDLNPSVNETIVLELAERASMEPVERKSIIEELTNNLSVEYEEVAEAVIEAENIGFVDTEDIEQDTRLLFNGNLFRRDEAKKINSLMKALSSEEQEKIIEMSSMLKTKACIPFQHATRLLGADLFTKVTAIGLFDISFVSNEKEEMGYVMLPSAFSKYGNPLEEDAFDLVKAFVSSITYGMTRSNYSRGNIRAVEALLTTLVNGDPVGPVQAIAQDYKVLEFKGVVQVYQGQKNGRTGPMLKLLKKEVGELALKAIRQGDISENSLTIFPTAAVHNYIGPELNRIRQRRNQRQTNIKSTNNMLSVLRSGGGK